MKSKLSLKILLAISVFIFITPLTFTVTAANTQVKLDKLQSQLNQLQTQVYLLKQQLRRQKAHTVKTSRGKRYYSSNKKIKSTRSAKSTSTSLTPTHLIPHSDAQMAQLVSRTPSIYFTDSVVIAPYTERATYNTGSELLVNAPSINEDAKLLLRRYLEQKKMMAIAGGVMPPFHPRLLLSGKLTGQVLFERQYSGGGKSDIKFTAAELDTFAEISPWVNGFMAFAYDDAPGSTARQLSNSRLHLDRGFIIIGNFNKSPIYGSIGQMFVPFGRYGSNMISYPLTYFIGKTKARAINIGLAPQGFNAPYARVFVFKGAATYGNRNIIKNGGIDLGFMHDKGIVNSEIGVSYIRNIADAEGFQKTGYQSTATITRFPGFDTASTTAVSDPENLKHGVPGVDVYGNIGIGKVNLLAEYVTATSSFSTQDLTFNSKGAKPSAYNFEAAYVFTIFRHPSSLAIGYAGTQQALGLNIPKRRYTGAFSITVLNNAKAMLEYRHDINYGKNDVATGNGLIAYVAKDRGRSDNVVTAETEVYF
jgi:hypothetical protein